MKKNKKALIQNLKINKMNKFNFSGVVFLTAVIAITFSSCAAIGGIFKAGVWFGVIGIVVVIAIIFWLINRARK